MIHQLLFNCIITSYLYLLLSFGFSTIYQTIKFFNFSHAITYIFGAYISFLFMIIMGVSYFIAIPIAIAVTIVLGGLTEFFIYRRMRNRKDPAIILLLASLGIYIVLQNLISLFFGDDTKSIRTWEVKEGIEIWGAYITPVQIIIIFTSLIFVALTAAYLNYTKTGKAMRAVASDNELAKLAGIISNKIILIAFAIGSALAGIAGILVALDVDMTPTMGMSMLLMGVVAMIIGGVGSIWGIVLGSLLLAIAQNLAVWFISSQWMDASTFLLLLIFLLFKPEGFLGKKIRRAEV